MIYYNIKNFTNDEISKLKDILFVDGKLNSKKIVKFSIYRQIPSLANKIEDEYFRESIYCLINDIEKIPLCPICHKPNRLRYFNKGFQKFCSRECVNKYQSISKDFGKKGAETRRKNNYDKREDKYISIPNNNRFVIYKNHCKHGDLVISNNDRRVFKKYPNSTLCPKCRQELYDSYIPTKEDIEQFQKEFKEFRLKNWVKFSDNWWMKFYPKEWKMINWYTENLFNDNGIPPKNREKYYIFENNVRERPKCPVCHKPVTYSKVVRTYHTGCNKHLYYFCRSKAEEEVQKFITSFNFKVISNTRSIIGKELDIVLPQQKIAIEFNGIFYHSDKSGSTDKQEWKRIKSLKNNYELISIWEDSWQYRKEETKKFIRNKIFKNFWNIQNISSAEISDDILKLIENKNHSLVIENGSHLLISDSDNYLTYDIDYHDVIIKTSSLELSLISRNAISAIENYFKNLNFKTISFAWDYDDGNPKNFLMLGYKPANYQLKSYAMSKEHKRIRNLSNLDISSTNSGFTYLTKKLD